MNGDGIEDLGLILTNTEGPGERSERLAVLAGHRNGQYTILSLSDEFCKIRQFYNMAVEGGTLLVTGYSSSSSRFSMRFRYNDKRKDLELIGEDEQNEDDEAKTADKLSINYLTRKISYSKNMGGKRKEVATIMPPQGLVGLQGFDCGTYDDKNTERYFYLNRDRPNGR
ncbi:hypothetical protein C7C56_003840 [Massilia glaciei]|uniref:Uncharacterized protein n=1 Tax=Massilia glaciei TaxID=1524097 RepID=A0A2U2I5I1_9BURK|nr:hypothetical protein C7C56_003840 [Massilia glaciei]